MSKASDNEMKKLAAYKAVDLFIKSNSVVGLGTGSTAYYVMEHLAHKLKNRTLENIVCVATSEKTTSIAKEEFQLHCVGLDDEVSIDVDIDGADEVDALLNVIKGKGGALLREKMVASASRLFIIIIDESKLTKKKSLGHTGCIPVEVIPFGYKYTQKMISNLDCLKKQPNLETQIRKTSTGDLFITDNQNYIIDILFEGPLESDIHTITEKLKEITGVVEHGIFTDIVSYCVVGKEDHSVQVLTRQE